MAKQYISSFLETINPQLAPKGIQQALDLSDEMQKRLLKESEKGKPIKIFATPLQRAVQTIHPTVLALKKTGSEFKAEIFPNLHEVGGEYMITLQPGGVQKSAVPDESIMTTRELNAKFPSFKTDPENFKADGRWYNSSGQEPQDIANRRMDNVLTWLNTIVKEQELSVIVLVSHRESSENILWRMFGSKPEQNPYGSVKYAGFNVPNASISTIQAQVKGESVVYQNKGLGDTSHLSKDDGGENDERSQAWPLVKKYAQETGVYEKFPI